MDFLPIQIRLLVNKKAYKNVQAKDPHSLLFGNIIVNMIAHFLCACFIALSMLHLWSPGYYPIHSLVLYRCVTFVSGYTHAYIYKLI